LQGKRDPEALVQLDVKEDADIETLSFVSDTPEGTKLLRVLKRAQNMTETITRKYIYGDQGATKMSVIAEGYRMKVVVTLVNAIRYSRMSLIQR
jgi:hypothetical protein